MIGRAAAGAALLALIALIALVPVAPAAAATSWLTPSNLSAPGRDASQPQAAVDSSGNAVAVWARSDGSDTIVQAASRPVGGSWSAAVDLSAPGRDAGEPQVAVDPAGNAVAVWARFDGAHTIVQSASRPAATGAWTAAADVSAAGRAAREPAVAVDPAGNAVAVWSRFDGANRIVQAARRPAGAGWLAPVDLSAPGRDADEAQVAVDPAGNVVAVWSRFEGSGRAVQSASMSAVGAWAPASDLSAPEGGAVEPQVAIDPAGNAFAVWSRTDGAFDIVQLAARPAAGAWSQPVDLSQPGQDATEPQLASGPAGAAAAIWTRADLGPYTVAEAAVKPAGGAWLAAEDLTPTGQTVETPQVAIDPAGNAVALWARSRASPTVVEGRIKPPGAAWGETESVSVIGLSAVEPQLALDPVGDGVAVWARDNGVNSIAQAAGIDGTGPRFLSVAIPAAATVRQPAAFSAAAFDAWSPLAWTAWSFGDGSGASGPSTAHAFARPGVYPVTVTSFDALGNGATAARAIRVFHRASAGRNLRVRGRTALLRVRCPSPAGCSAAPRLIAGDKARRGRRRVGKRVRIGGRQVSVPGARTTTVRIRLTRKGAALARRASRRRGLRAQLTGPGIKHRLVVLWARRGRTRNSADGPKNRHIGHSSAHRRVF